MCCLDDENEEEDWEAEHEKLASNHLEPGAGLHISAHDRMRADDGLYGDDLMYNGYDAEVGAIAFLSYICLDSC